MKKNENNKLRQSSNKEVQAPEPWTFGEIVSGVHQVLNQANIDMYNATNHLIEEDPDLTTDQRIKALWENSAMFREQTAETAYTVLKIGFCVVALRVAYKNPDMVKSIQRSLKKVA